jgi:hypothetical protein
MSLSGKIKILQFDKVEVEVSPNECYLVLAL